MRQSLGHGVVGALLLLLAGCGGTVDLETEDDATPGSAGGSGGTAQSGGSGGTAQSNGSGGAGGTGGTGAVPGSAGGSGGSDDTKVPERPATGVLAFDANSNGLGRVVYLMSLSAGDCAEALTDPSVQAKQPTFSVDGARIAYAAQVDGIYQIHVRDLESGHVEQVTDLESGATSPAFFPDGEKIVFVTGDPETPGNAEPGAGSLMLVELASLEVTMMSDRENLGCCAAQYLSPTFNSDYEILVGTRMSLVGIDVSTGDVRDVVPITGRIPNPQDPSVARDGVRYVFSDFCGAGLGLYVALVDGSSGDTCTGALAIDTGHKMISADWGDWGYIAAEIDSTEHGVLFINDTDFSVTSLGHPGARNPAWAPLYTEFSIQCE